jgi:AmiR/NasT family two-component response regulator
VQSDPWEVDFAIEALVQSPSPSIQSNGNGAKLAPQISAATSADENKVRCLRITVAGDDPAILQEHQERLSRLGHHVCLAHAGRQLVEQCRLLRPDLVLTDIQIPDLDGIAAAEEICQDWPTPIILVPGNPDTEFVQRALGNPCVLACLSLPIREADLRLAITLVMRRFQQYQAVCQEAAELRQTLEERKVIERAKGLVMRFAGLDEQEAFRRLQKMASDQNRKLVEVAQAVLAAGEVFEQLDPSRKSRPR